MFKFIVNLIKREIFFHKHAKMPCLKGLNPDKHKRVLNSYFAATNNK